MQPIWWIGLTIVSATGKIAPIRIAADTLGNHSDLLVSPQQRIMLLGWQQELLFGELQTLAPAVMLLDGATITRQRGALVEYHHMLFDSHETVFAEGAPCESFQPGHVGMGSFSDATRAEILELFLQLVDNRVTYGPAARMSLKAHEVKLLARDPACAPQ